MCTAGVLEYTNRGVTQVMAARRKKATRKKATRRRKKATEPEEQRAEDAGEKVVEIVRSLERDYDTVWGSMVKQTIRRVYPSFNEVYYGASSFANLLESVEKEGLIELEFDDARGNYIVRSASRKR